MKTANIVLCGLSRVTDIKSDVGWGAEISYLINIYWFFFTPPCCEKVAAQLFLNNTITSEVSHPTLNMLDIFDTSLIVSHTKKTFQQCYMKFEWTHN